MRNSKKYSIAFIIILCLQIDPGFSDEAKTLWYNAFQSRPIESGEQAPNLPPTDSCPTLHIHASQLGMQFVRVSVPLPYGFLRNDERIELETYGGKTIVPDVRILTTFGGSVKYVRRAILTFCDEFIHSTKPYTIKKVEAKPQENFPADGSLKIGDYQFDFDQYKLIVRKDGQIWITFRIVLPDDPSPVETFPVEILEQGEHYLWVRWLQWHPSFPRIVELRANSLGQIAMQLNLQRIATQDGYSPQFGIVIEGTGEGHSYIPTNQKVIEDTPLTYELSTGDPFLFQTSDLQVAFPDAHHWRKGVITVETNASQWSITYLRCRNNDRVPHQPMAWRSAKVYVGPKHLPTWNELLEPPTYIQAPIETWKHLYPISPCIQPDNEILQEAIQWHRNAMASTRIYGDDFGNVSTMPTNSVFGMNRLNHATEIYYESLRTNNSAIRSTFLLWCQNFAQLSIWWGNLGKPDFGGTRYNNIRGRNPEAHADDDQFMWRSNDAVSFCTKGFDNFLFAYEETGDPFYANCLTWQVEYAKQNVHANTGECRNIGIVKDFLILFYALGEKGYAEHALRLFRELKEKLSENYLFSQGGQPIRKGVPFIETDSTGYQNPFPKPYILGYALQGLPGLYSIFPEESGLFETVESVAKYMADTVDPVGGWRYPHPRSPLIFISQGIEHAYQLANACTILASRSPHLETCLNAVETVLQARIASLRLNNGVLNSIGAWEYATGKVEPGKNLESVYKTFEERDYQRDYTEGSISCSDALPPEGVVYFTSVLNFYLQHRDPQRLLIPTKPDLRIVLSRAFSSQTTPGNRTEKTCTIDKFIPHFVTDWLQIYTPSLRFNPYQHTDFNAWKQQARQKVFECLGYPPPFSFFNPVILYQEDRGEYTAQKLLIHISQWAEIPAYLLIPKGTPPFPAIICLHDHGGYFKIGKEKVIKPIAESEEINRYAEEWVNKYYGGRFIGDELAKRGYVVFSIDALFWGSRQECGGSKHEHQQKVSSNILHMGSTWLGIITWDDLRSVEFVAGLPMVDPDRIGAIGLSMGAHRTWMLCGLTDKVKVGCAICWFATTPTIIVPDNVSSLGDSAYSMLAPNLYQYLDIPDIASLACPKPMLFFNGTYDTLFPIEGVKDGFQIMRTVWESQGKSELLNTKIWDVPHEFNLDMQSEAFQWLDKHLK